MKATIDPCPAGQLIDLTIDYGEDRLRASSSRSGTLRSWVVILPFLILGIALGSDYSVFNGRQVAAILVLILGWRLSHLSAQSIDPSAAAESAPNTGRGADLQRDPDKGPAQGTYLRKVA